MFFGAAAVTILAACLIYDSWLRPLPAVALFAGITILLSSLIAFGRGLWLRITAAIVLFFILLAAPIASLRRVWIIQNATDGELRIDVRHRTESREKSKKVHPGDSWRFIYFSGDYGRITNVPVTLKITALSAQNSKSAQFDLPLTTNPPPLVVNNVWLGR